MRSSKLLAATAVAALALGGTACATGDDDSPGVVETNPAEGAEPEPFEGGAPISPTALDTEAEPGTEGGGAAPEQDQYEYSGALVVDSQGSDGSSVLIDEVDLRYTDGWVSIREAAGEAGGPGEVLGYSQLDDADTKERHYEDVVVELDEPLSPGTHRLWAVVHIDGGEKGRFEYPGPDVVLDADGAPVQAAFELDVR